MLFSVALWLPQNQVGSALDSPQNSLLEHLVILSLKVWKPAQLLSTTAEIWGSNCHTDSQNPIGFNLTLCSLSLLGGREAGNPSGLQHLPRTGDSASSQEHSFFCPSSHRTHRYSCHGQKSGCIRSPSHRESQPLFQTTLVHHLITWAKDLQANAQLPQCRCSPSQ